MLLNLNAFDYTYNTYTEYKKVVEFYNRQQPMDTK